MRDERLPLRQAIPVIIIAASLWWGVLLTLLRVWR